MNKSLIKAINSFAGNLTLLSGMQKALEIQQKILFLKA